MKSGQRGSSRLPASAVQPIVLLLATAGLYAVASAEATASDARTGTTVVLVTLGDATIRLAPSSVTAGGVVFRVVNKGRTSRDFEVAGKRTTPVAPGKSASLQVELTKRPYRYVSRGAGHAGPLTGLVGVLAPCTHPTASTLNVTITLGQISLSRTTVPCGSVTLLVTNGQTAGDNHQFSLAIATLVSGGVFAPRLRPRKSARLTVNLPYKGKVYYFCQEPEHAENGESGFLTVK
jgi:uncharacterized cupredoxin-like copper-binding protein